MLLPTLPLRVGLTLNYCDDVLTLRLGIKPTTLTLDKNHRLYERLIMRPS